MYSWLIYNLLVMKNMNIQLIVLLTKDFSRTEIIWAFDFSKKFWTEKEFSIFVIPPGNHFLGKNVRKKSKKHIRITTYLFEVSFFEAIFGSYLKFLTNLI